VKPAPNSSVVLLNLEWPLEAIPCLENFGTATRAAHRSYFWTRYADEPSEPYLSTRLANAWTRMEGPFCLRVLNEKFR
jgi:hypothetical protein